MRYSHDFGPLVILGNSWELCTGCKHWKPYNDLTLNILISSKLTEILSKLTEILYKLTEILSKFSEFDCFPLSVSECLQQQSLHPHTLVLLKCLALTQVPIDQLTDHAAVDRLHKLIMACLHRLIHRHHPGNRGHCRILCDDNMFSTFFFFIISFNS